jgi:hypothetical protein
VESQRRAASEGNARLSELVAKELHDSRSVEEGLSSITEELTRPERLRNYSTRELIFLYGLFGEQLARNLEDLQLALRGAPGYTIFVLVPGE